MGVKQVDVAVIFGKSKVDKFIDLVGQGYRPGYIFKTIEGRSELVLTLEKRTDDGSTGVEVSKLK